MTNKAVNRAFEKLWERYARVLRALLDAYDELDKKPSVIEKESTKDLRLAATLIAATELNPNKLSEQEIYEILIKQNDDEVKKKIGFWASPLPKDDSGSNTITTYRR